MNGTLMVPASGVDTLGKATIDVGDVGNYTYMAQWDKQLFEGPPKVADVKQGGIGNCYILAALMAVLQQPRGPAFVEGMMFDQWNPLGPRPSLAAPAYVVVRLYDAFKTPHYVKSRKMTVIDSRTINSQGADQAFSKGALWVSIFEQAFLALDGNGDWQSNSPKFSNVVGSNTKYSALKSILGVDVEAHSIPDLADPGERASAFTSNIANKFGKEQTLFFEQAMNPAEIGKQLVQNDVKARIFGGQQNLYAAFIAWAQAQDPSAPPIVAPVQLQAPAQRQWVRVQPQPPVRPTHLRVFRDTIVQKPKNMIRYEDIETFFGNKGLDNNTAQAILGWLDTNKIVPGKKFTQKYSQWEEYVYNELIDADTNHRPAVLATRASIGTAEGLGLSANEPKVKGLVGDHEYPLLGVEIDQGRKFVTIRNPWGEYGRTYVPDPDNQRARATAQDSPTSRLPLQEITKRFRRFQVAQLSLG